MTSDDDRYITWFPHPDPEVEHIFRKADQDGYVIYQHKGVYTLVSPDVMEDFQFLGRVVSSSLAWQLMITDLRHWLARTARDEMEGKG